MWPRKLVPSRPRLESDLRDAPPLILMYHRIGAEDEDPWGLAVSPERFGGHLDILGRRKWVVPLHRIVEDCVAGSPSRGTVAITFDDGYADSLSVAKPLIDQHGFAATVFAVTGAIGAHHEYWWDELGRILLLPGRLPVRLNLSEYGSVGVWDIGEDARYTDRQARRHRSWRAWESPPTRRHDLYRTLWQWMHDLSSPQRDRILYALRCWAGSAAKCRPGRRVLTLAELRCLAADGTIEIGAHSATHDSMPNLSMDAQREEAARSKAFLEEHLARPVTAFSYPYGDCSAATIAAIQAAGFAYACTTRSGNIDAAVDPYQLPRVHVYDWDKDAFERCISAASAT